MALLLLANVTAFLLAMLFGMALTTVLRRRAPAQPSPGSLLRIRSNRTVYRSRFMGVGPSGWRFATPLQRDAYVPIRVGEPLTIEALEDDRVLLYRTVLRNRTDEIGEMFTDPPRRVYVTPRLDRAKKTPDEESGV